MTDEVVIGRNIFQVKESPVGIPSVRRELDINVVLGSFKVPIIVPDKALRWNVDRHLLSGEGLRIRLLSRKRLRIRLKSRERSGIHLLGLQPKSEAFQSPSHSSCTTELTVPMNLSIAVSLQMCIVANIVGIHLWTRKPERNSLDSFPLTSCSNKSSSWHLYSKRFGEKSLFRREGGVFL